MVVEQKYNWTRFWCPRSGTMLLGDHGFLSDPESDMGKYLNIGVVPYEEIAKFQCLVILGEPGMGKSNELEKHRKSIEKTIRESGDICVNHNLRDFQTDHRLCNRIFGSSEFITWLTGKNKLYLFLDSLDEGLLSIKVLATLLSSEFGNCPIDRLYIRLACRTADWPIVLENGLTSLWGKDRVGIFELAPLRRKDVISLAKIHGFDEENFLKEILSKEAVPLAIKPVTLRLLANLYAKDGYLPRTKTELFELGCRLLCEEISQSRHASGWVGVLTANQRLMVASRMAAVTIFANRSAIWTGINVGDVPEEDLTIAELVGGIETVNEQDFEITQTGIRETLNTGLFSARGPNRLGWAHQTYAEFLAAFYVNHHDMTTTQINSILIHQDDPGNRLIPQLHETTAWLAGMNPEVFSQVMTVEPKTLLSSDVAIMDLASRETLTENLLKQFDDEKLSDIDWSIQQRYKKLKHGNLPQQLRLYFCDQTKGVMVRRVAIDIAESCEVVALLNDLLSVALNQTDDVHIRAQAACAIARIGDEEAKTQLKVLALGQGGEDPDDELKGYGLRSVWPNHIASEELFSTLTQPKRPNFFGSYQDFLKPDLVKELRDKDLIIALNWVLSIEPVETLSPLEDIVNSIMVASFKNVESPGVLEVLAKTLLHRYKNNESRVYCRDNTEFRDAIGCNDNNRRLVANAIIQLVTFDSHELSMLVYVNPPLVLSKDVPWILELLQQCSTEPEQRKLSELLFRVFEPDNVEAVEAIYSACKYNRILEQRFNNYFGTVDLTSDETNSLRAQYQQRQKWTDRPKRQPLSRLSMIEQVDAHLEKIESGDIDAWWHLNLVLLVDPETRFRKESEWDLTASSGWNLIDISTKDRIVETAKRYVLDGEPNTKEWLGTKTIHRPALAGYRALQLLLTEDPAFIKTISKEVWGKWAPIIVDYPTPSGIGNEQAHQRLIEIAYDSAPDDIIDTLLIIIEKENQEYDNIFIVRKMLGCWDRRLIIALTNKVKELGLKPKCMGVILAELLDHGVSQAKEFSEYLVNNYYNATDHNRFRATVASCVLMKHANDAGWGAVWPAIQCNTDFGREVLQEVATGLESYNATIAQKLSEEQLADLFIWLVNQFPFAEDPRHEEVHCVEPRESIANWKNSMLQNLKNRGTRNTIIQMDRIIQALPTAKWLVWSKIEAENLTRSFTWMPLKPEAVIAIAKNKEMRLVSSGEQLLDVLIESLNRLEAKLQGESPGATDLWNEAKLEWFMKFVYSILPLMKGKLPKKTMFRPKDENAFSDYVKRHLVSELRDRGIVVNREVEISRGMGVSQGERTDIHVNAIVPGPRRNSYDVLTAIIEVKGCWHKDLMTAMKTQLKERYLREYVSNHCIYLVGWFNCSQWDESDSRKNQAPKSSPEDLQSILDLQARELSEHSKVVKAIVMNGALR